LFRRTLLLVDSKAPLYGCITRRQLKIVVIINSSSTIIIIIILKAYYTYDKKYVLRNIMIYTPRPVAKGH